MNLPSAHQLNDSVNIYPSFEAMKKPLSQLIAAKVVGVIFSVSKIYYNLKINATGEVLENVDSSLIYSGDKPRLTLNDIWTEQYADNKTHY